MVRLKVPNKDLNVLNQENVQIDGDVICANFKDSTDC